MNPSRSAPNWPVCFEPGPPRTARSCSTASRRRSQVYATIVAPGFGKPWITWNPARPVSIVLDGRLGRVEGRLKPPGGRRLPGKLLGLVEPQGPARRASLNPIPGALLPDRLGRSGWRVPVRRRATRPLSRSAPSSARIPARGARNPGSRGRPERRRPARDPGPGALTITGRILDAQTGKGIEGISLRSTLLNAQNHSLQSIGEARTDADGRYTIEARPGKVQVQPNAYRRPTWGYSRANAPGWMSRPSGPGPT